MKLKFLQLLDDLVKHYQILWHLGLYIGRNAFFWRVQNLPEKW
jgi:hypothetical protein